MNFYGNRFSDRCRIAKHAINHAKIEHSKIAIDLMKGEQKSEAHLKRCPQGKVPVIEDGDFFLSEAIAIAKYVLDTKAPGNTLYPTDPKKRAVIN